MDGSRFDAITRTLAASRSRRTTVRAFAAGAVAVGLGRLGLAAAKKKKRKKNLKKNAYGCVNVGNACRGKDANCCSGICQGNKPKKGKKDTSKCVAHNALDCPAGADTCLPGVTIPCGTDGECFQTTGRASYCGGEGLENCLFCNNDTDCEADFGLGAACVVCPQNCGLAGRACISAAG